VRSGACVVALFGMLCIAAGCREDDKNADPAPLTIVTDIDFTTERGTFRVKRGSQELGCSGGTFVTRHLGQDEWSTLQMVSTCTEGERSGSFFIRIKNLHLWNFQSGTGDFAGVRGKGKGKLTAGGNAGPNRTGPYLTGTVRYS